MLKLYENFQGIVNSSRNRLHASNLNSANNLRIFDGDVIKIEKSENLLIMTFQTL